MRDPGNEVAFRTLPTTSFYSPPPLARIGFISQAADAMAEASGTFKDCFEQWSLFSVIDRLE